MANIYESRWQSALRIHKKLRSLWEADCVLYNKDKQIVGEPYIRLRDPLNKNDCDELGFIESTNVSIVYFSKNIEIDEGMHTTIKEYKKYFDGWTYADPKYTKKLKI